MKAQAVTTEEIPEDHFRPGVFTKRSPAWDAFKGGLFGFSVPAIFTVFIAGVTALFSKSQEPNRFGPLAAVGAFVSSVGATVWGYRNYEASIGTNNKLELFNKYSSSPEIQKELFNQLGDADAYSWKNSTTERVLHVVSNVSLYGWVGSALFGLRPGITTTLLSTTILSTFGEFAMWMVDAHKGVKDNKVELSRAEKIALERVAARIKTQEQAVG